MFFCSASVELLIVIWGFGEGTKNYFRIAEGDLWIYLEYIMELIDLKDMILIARLKKQVLASFAKSAEDVFRAVEQKNMMQKLAKEFGVVIPVSFFEEANNAHYNSVAIIDPDGTDLGLYRKSHIPDGPGYQEKFYFNSGDTGFKWFPEAAQAMVLQGAKILFYPTAIGFEPQDTRLDSRDHWTRVMQGHAGANLVPLVASNRIGKEIIKTKHGNSEIIFYCNSFIARPTGEIVVSADDKDGAVLVAQFDL
ncbi:hypothetical protein TEA_028850 [Camellia sinensis var. sinensis]|uniref:CN hydrolase domain-containing protein n=1 Tax=Camellia sinensis var. sinensis TaxID=542762 RepID=A0A4S4E883_CAMSN|nr:hypothetical protein TEA_028850 [Camellia sinensis var. sinensis]